MTGGGAGGNALFMCRLIWKDKPLMKAESWAGSLAAETNSRHPAASHQLLQTQLERKSLAASAHAQQITSLPTRATSALRSLHIYYTVCLNICPFSFVE